MKGIAFLFYYVLFCLCLSTSPLCFESIVYFVRAKHLFFYASSNELIYSGLNIML